MPPPPRPVPTYTPLQKRWDSFGRKGELEEHFRDLGAALRNRALDLGRTHYAIPLALAVQQAICCGTNKLAAVELGVCTGTSLLDLCKAAAFFRDTMDMDIRVYGFDNTIGLPEPVGYRDQPEIWWGGQFTMVDQAGLTAKLPPFAELVIGDIADTVDAFHATLQERPLGFLSIDVDLYSSTVSGLRLLDWEPTCYLPAIPVYADDVDVLLTYNDWCGEELAIREFNDRNALRKIQRAPAFDLKRFFVAHIMDHPIRTGAEKPKFPLHIRKI